MEIGGNGTWVDGNTLYLHCDSGYMSMYFHQSLAYIAKIGIYSLVKLIFLILLKR